ncbi:energy transducer TonB [Paraburkholderia sp.]|uniref:energy transducer TonB n=1 Tax=Paraburkholderia sp. TaxID=1926495 RepID=UPI0025EDEED1|nr:energy transducer TonB [Paraburkholderia sp.]
MTTMPIARVAPGKHRLPASAAVALVVEMAILALAWSILRHKSAEPPRERPPTMLSLTSTPAPKPAPPVPRPQPPRPVVQPPRPHAVRPVHHVEHAVPPRAVPVPQPAPSPAPAPVAAAVPPEAAQPRAPVAPPAPPAPSRASPTFESALRDAIQAALHYPESARMAGMAGRTRVEFQYRDGAVSGARVVVSSGVAMLDRAALAAVHDANYPKPEAGFAGKTLTEQLWVNFSLSEQE